MRTCIACGLLLIIGCAKTEQRDSSFSDVKLEVNYSVDDLVAGLKKEDREERHKAALGLKKKGAEAKAAAPALVEALKDKDKEVREAAAAALAGLGPAGRTQAVPACIALLRSSDEASRQQGQELLALVSPISLKVLELKDAEKRRDAATALVKDAPDLVEAIPVLLEVRKEAGAKKDRDLVQVVDYVGKYGKLDKAEAVPALIAGLNDSDPHVRAVTLLILERLGKTATAALPTLTELMKNASDRKVYNEYLAAYKKISGWDGATPTPTGPVKLGAAWLTDFPSFLEDLRTILGPSPVWPDGNEPGLLSITEDNRVLFLVPRRYPAAAANSTRVFHDKTVTWELVVEEVKVEDEDVFVHFKPPPQARLNAIHPRLARLNQFSVRMDESNKDAAKRLKEGQRITIKADVGHEPLDGIYLMFGVGMFREQMQLSIQLRKGMIVR